MVPGDAASCAGAQQPGFNERQATGADSHQPHSSLVGGAQEDAGALSQHRIVRPRQEAAGDHDVVEAIRLAECLSRLHLDAA